MLKLFVIWLLKVLYEIRSNNTRSDHKKTLVHAYHFIWPIMHMSSKKALQQTRLQKTNIYNVPSDELKNMYYEIVRNKNLRLSKNVTFCTTLIVLQLVIQPEEYLNQQIWDSHWGVQQKAKTTVTQQKHVGLRHKHLYNEIS